MTTAIPIPTFVEPPTRTYTAQMLDTLEDSREWELVEDVLVEVLRAWRAVEDGDLLQADRLLGELTASLRARRDRIETSARRPE